MSSSVLTPSTDVQRSTSIRVGITGYSDGATVALFAAALSNWIAVAVSCCYFCPYEDAILVIEHCEGNYMPRLIDPGEMWAGTDLVAHWPLAIDASEDDQMVPDRHTPPRVRRAH